MHNAFEICIESLSIVKYLMFLSTFNMFDGVMFIHEGKLNLKVFHICNFHFSNPWKNFHEKKYQGKGDENAIDQKLRIKI